MKPLLQVEGVSKSFARGGIPVRVLENVSMEVHDGELFAIYGKRASGKTTLLEIAAGLADPDAGTVSFNGRDMARMSQRQLAGMHRDHVGWVEREGPQATDVPMRAHVALPLYRRLSRRQADLKALAMLERVGVREYADARWSDLPTSVRVFVTIAQALVREPQLLVVDDPIYGLAVTEREAVTGLLRDVAERAGLAVLLAVPEMPAMLHAHQVRVLAGGSLIGPAPDGTRSADVIEFPRPNSA